MELNRNTILEIFKNNFDFPIVETIIGTAVKMDARSAFHFSNITGAGYLDDATYPFTPKGVMKILREAFQYNIVTGIFDRHRVFYSPTELAASKAYLFDSDKYVILKECSSEPIFNKEIQAAYDILRENHLKSTDYIIFRIEAWKNGNGMECFLEYLACEYFLRRGYIVENQIPLVYAVGSPDFGGFKLKHSGRGFHILELAMLKITKNYELLKQLEIEHIIVGEAKTATTIMTEQLKKYMNTGVFYKGYEMHPDKNHASKAYFGLFHIDDDFAIRVDEPTEEYRILGEEIFDYGQYMTWYENYIKFYIVANLTNSELEDFVEGIRQRGKYNQKKLIDAVISTPLMDMVNYVKEVLTCQQECPVTRL